MLETALLEKTIVMTPARTTERDYDKYDAPESLKVNSVEELERFVFDGIEQDKNINTLLTTGQVRRNLARSRMRALA